MSSGLPSVTDHFAPECALINASEALFNRACEQWNVRNFAEMFGDEPDRFFRRHPVLTIKSSEIHRTRISPQGAFTAQIEVDVEVTHRQFAQAAINRFAISAPGEIRFRHRAPVSAHLENGDHMIGVLLCFQIENERWKSEDAERRCSENPSFEARCRSIAQNLLRRSRREAEVVGQIVERPLDASRRLERAQPAQLRTRESKSVTASHKGSSNIQAPSSRETSSLNVQINSRPFTDLTPGASLELGAWDLGFRADLQPHRMPCFEAAWRTIGGLPARRPVPGIIVVWRGIESQPGDNGKSMTVACVNGDPFATAALPVPAKFSRAHR